MKDSLDQLRVESPSDKCSCHTGSLECSGLSMKPACHHLAGSRLIRGRCPNGCDGCNNGECIEPLFGKFLLNCSLGIAVARPVPGRESRGRPIIKDAVALGLGHGLRCYLWRNAAALEVGQDFVRGANVRSGIASDEGQGARKLIPRL